MHDTELKLPALANKLMSKLSKAKQHRANTGIESIWEEDQEYYEGIDDANRSTVSGNKLGKDAIEYHYGTRNYHTGSTVFLNITRAYVDSATASDNDMLLPVDELPFSMDPTPIPSLNEMAKMSNHPMQADVAAQGALDEAKQKAEKAETVVSDYLIECSFNRELRKVMKDAHLLGTGVLKGPVPVKTKQKKVSQIEDGTLTIEIEIKTCPASYRIDPRNLFPDPACGENIHNGSYVFEREMLSGKQLQDMLGSQNIDGSPIYLDENIKQVLKQGPGKKYEDRETQPNEADKFEAWHYYGTATAEDLDMPDLDTTKTINIIAMVIDGVIIKATLAVLNSGEFPYDVMVYQPRDNHWAGIGIARQIREPQRILNAAVRNLLDNAGKGGSPIVVLADGVEMEGAEAGEAIYLGRNTILRLSPDSSVQDARQAVTSITIPMISQELLNIIQFAQKMAEDVTGMPLLLQGQQGSAPDTVGGLQILQQNSSAPRKAVAKNFDDLIIVPHIKRYYEWLMIYGEEEVKGDFQINAKGSSIFFERDASRTALIQMGALLANREIGINPQKYGRQLFKAHKIDPDTVLYSPEEMQKMAEQQQPPANPALEVAQIRAQTDIQKAQMAQQLSEQENTADMELEKAKILFDREQQELERQHQLQLAQIERDTKILELSLHQKISVEQIKAQLAQTTQKLQVQTVLSKRSSQAMTPPTEPAGRAQNGHAFEQ